MKSGVKLIAFICIAGIAGCSAARPVLYPNEHLRALGPEMALRERRRSPIAVGGAVVGSAGSGSAIGAASGVAAGLLRGLFSRSEPSQVYVAFVNQCLQERGYKVIGWE